LGKRKKEAEPEGKGKRKTKTFREYKKKSNIENAFDLFKQMQRMRIRAIEIYNNFLLDLTEWKLNNRAQKFFANMTKKGNVTPNAQTYGIMVSMYISSNALFEAKEIFNTMKEVGLGGDMSFEEAEKLCREYGIEWFLLLQKTYKTLTSFKVEHVKSEGKVTKLGYQAQSKAEVNLIYSFNGKKKREDIIYQMRKELGKNITKAKVQALIATKPKSIEVDENGFPHPDVLDDWIVSTRKKLEGEAKIKADQEAQNVDTEV